MILDWHLAPGCSLREACARRVREVGCAEFLRLSAGKFASDRNDTLSALAQPWFGMIMTSEPSRRLLVEALVREGLPRAADGAARELTVIENGLGEDGAVVPSTGTMAVERMLSGPPAGLEQGHSIEVRPLRAPTRPTLRIP